MCFIYFISLDLIRNYTISSDDDDVDVEIVYTISSESSEPNSQHSPASSGSYYAPASPDSYSPASPDSYVPASPQPAPLQPDSPDSPDSYVPASPPPAPMQPDSPQPQPAPNQVLIAFNVVSRPNIIEILDDSEDENLFRFGQIVRRLDFGTYVADSESDLSDADSTTERELKCPVCLNSPLQFRPRAPVCGHIAYTPCWNEWLTSCRERNVRKNCMVCRSTIRSKREVRRLYAPAKI